MPRKKKHRKHGKNTKFGGSSVLAQLSKPSSSNKIDKIKLLQSNSMSDTMGDAGDAEYSTPLRPIRTRKDSFELDTPAKKSHVKEDVILSSAIESSAKLDPYLNNTSVELTPVNKRRSLNRQNEIRLNGTWNTTNLNVLFDLDAEVHGNHISSIKDIDNRPRFSSSISKLHSPGTEKVLSFHKSTQTMDEDELRHEMKHTITETPKLLHKKLSDNNLNSQEMDKIVNNLAHVSSSTKISQNDKLQEIHINPYLKEKDAVNLEINAQISRWQKERSVDDMFYSPHLFDLKSSSTPIQEEKLCNLKESDVIEKNLEPCVKKLFNNKPVNEIGHHTPGSARLKDQFLNNSVELTSLVGTPHRLEDINLNTPPVAEKVINKYKSNSFKQLGSTKKKTPLTINRTSPRINRLSYYRTSPKTLSFAKLSNSRRSALNNSCEMRSSTIQPGMFDRMVNKIKRYSKASAKWSTKVMDSCTQLGIQIKNSFSTICQVANDRSMLECSQSSCDFEICKMEIENLNKKLDEVNAKIAKLMEGGKDGLKHLENMTKLHEEMEQMKLKLSSYTSLRTELDSMKKEIQSIKSSGLVGIERASSLAPIAIPPPPPPPPPPMPEPPKGPSNRILIKSKSTLGCLSSRAEDRPVISLDEILKVKLKKPSERPSVTPQRRPMPALQDDQFHHVKLRSKTMAKHFPIRSNSFSSPSRSRVQLVQSTSPASSLNRLLENGSVWPMKRLRRGGYSFDSVHRKSLMSPSRRERTPS
ncbi:uncharacterized protein LOC109537078 isoform X2 [Dendroctonus ponderosae]|nr:uncharacterized protein LOC109537078 isoform X2 [Dendroctonus ponderosae]XP_019759192.2 uncharacterized protein LOC109537078 isoform X2 [Dendroctonus ponderosae]XP_048521924.1 uncharacterized protein LOC109537078 isoform X2 [Dendroctonus ponderosae]KAH1018773.1 hypothetical protein HUJ05_006477 [Dendroctonus ponderosae]KAH1018774.1 hypothetical protein HUJ05_006477 [Dendroctonus ponderosae]